MKARRVTRWRGDGGQASVELAIALPLAVMVLLAMIQVGLVARDRLAIELAAREGARAAAVSADPATAARLAAERVTNLEPLDVTVSLGTETVTVTVRTVNETDLAMIGNLLPPVSMSATVTMALEPPS